MTAWDFPDAICEVEFTPGVWTDLSSRLRPSFAYSCGRSRERDRPEAARSTIVLDNFDRELEPKNTSSSYWPNVRPLKRVRMFAVVEGVPIPLFTHFVAAWEMHWGANGFDATVTIEAADAFSVLALSNRALYSQEVLADKPVGYWRLNEPAGAIEVVDYGSEDHPLKPGVGATLGFTPGPLAGGAPVLDQASSGSETGVFAADVDDNFWFVDPVVEFWINPDSFPAHQGSIVTLATTSQTSVYIFHSSSSGVLNLLFEATGVELVHTTSSAILTTGAWQHIAAVKRGSAVDWYKNGVLFETTTVAGGGADPPSSKVILSLGAFIVANPAGIDGKLAHVAIYDQHGLTAGSVSVFPPSRIAAHYAATLGDIGTAASDEQIELLLDFMGWPAGDRDIEPGVFTLNGFATSDSLLDSALSIATSEGGLFFADPVGKIAFFANDHTSPTGLVFGTEAGELLFEDIELDYDEVQVWNDITVNAPPLVQRLEDARSIAFNRRRTQTFDTVLANLTDVGKRARELLVNYREPRQRIAAIEHTKAQSDWSEIIPVRLLDEVGAIITPPGGGDPITQPSRVERIALSSDNKQDWKLRWELSALPRRNLLTHEQASPDSTGTLQWVPLANCAVARVTSPVLTGVGALRMTATAGGDMSIETTVASLPSTVVGTPYVASAFFISPVTARSAHVEIRWFAGAAFLSASVGADITTANRWLGAWCDGVVPASATIAKIALVVEAAGAGEIQYADEALFTLDD